MSGQWVEACADGGEEFRPSPTAHGSNAGYPCQPSSQRRAIRSLPPFGVALPQAVAPGSVGGMGPSAGTRDLPHGPTCVRHYTANHARLIPLKKLGRLALQGVADGIERREVDALGRLLLAQQPLGSRGIDRPVGHLRQLVRRGDRGGVVLHEFAQAQSHIEHDTNVSMFSSRCNPIFTIASTCERARLQTMVNR